MPAEAVGSRDQAFEVKLLLPESVYQSMLSAESHDRIGTAVHRVLRLIRTANSLAAGMPFESVAELEQLLTTGIVDTVESPEAPLLDQRAQTRRLLEQLSDDNELSGFARLAQQLIAAISLPRTLSEPDELQIGGVSDISNRGHLDQLLLSELAQDDLTLAVRLALNEALYLRRESPPLILSLSATADNQQFSRSVLLNSLRCLSQWSPHLQTQLHVWRFHFKTEHKLSGHSPATHAHSRRT